VRLTSLLFSRIINGYVKKIQYKDVKLSLEVIVIELWIHSKTYNNVLLVNLGM